MPVNRTSNSCRGKRCRCNSSLSRRDFIRTTAAGTAIGAYGLPVMAGPFENENEYLKLIPTDKKLDPAWIRSLYTRGKKDVYSDPEALKHIGMPVGGLFAGTVYLGGDGRLWLWDIFNRDQEGINSRESKGWPGKGIEDRMLKRVNRAGLNYVDPSLPVSPFNQGFAIRIGEVDRTLDSGGFSEITFDGRYPIGRVTYRDNDSPLAVALEAYSPFIPLNADDSSLPATVMSYTIHNESDKAVECEVRGWLENAVCLYNRQEAAGNRLNRVIRGQGYTALECSATEGKKPPSASRPDIVFDDFEDGTYGKWASTGTAFGNAPADLSKRPDYQGKIGGRGKRVVNSHASAPGKDVRERDAQLGTLASESFVIERNYINFLIGGGDHAGKTCMNLVVDGEIVVSATGRKNNLMGPDSFHTAHLIGKTAHLEIIDNHGAGWGNIGIDHIVFSDQPGGPRRNLAELHDFGTMTLTVLDEDSKVKASAETGESGQFTKAMKEGSSDLSETLIGGMERTLQLAPGEAKTVTFILTWHFPNFYSRGVGGDLVGHSYAARFDDAIAVSRYIANNFERLSSTTRKWVETWYDSSLPYWLLDRTMANTSTLATTTCYRFKSGRFWAWEGIGCCPGTCTHVWHYAQAPGRLFPEIERGHREHVDFGVALHEDGGIGMRAKLDSANHAAHDGQCGRILGVLREHQMSTDDAFLKRLWPKVKHALEFMMAQDGNGDGMIEGAQPNTLDAAWYGKVPGLVSLYLAALHAGEAMANERGDTAFARKCASVAKRGAQSILATFNGEYFHQVIDPDFDDRVGTGPGCYIDQVFGQTWAHHVGLERLFDRDKQLSALRALYKYNFVPDVGPFRDSFHLGRWYATAGDAGLIMCSWPKGGENPKAKEHWQYGYFNECMSGFEWQAASHMIWEGLDQPDQLEHGLAVSRAIHDRYNGALRNPYNEIECSDHYSRAMASYGVFMAASGYEYHGPKGHIAFIPRLNAADFKAAFTSAEAWGSIAQKRTGNGQQQRIEVKHGQLRLRTVAFELEGGQEAKEIAIVLAHKPIAHEFTVKDRRVTVKLAKDVIVRTGQTIVIETV